MENERKAAERKRIGNLAMSARKEQGWSMAFLLTKLKKASGLFLTWDTGKISRLEHGQARLAAEEAPVYASVLGKPSDYFTVKDERSVVSPRHNDEVPVVIQIPIYDQDASMGPGAPIQSYAYKAPNGTAGKNIAGIRVKGDCLSPLLQEDDIVFFDREGSPHDKSLVVVILDGMLNVKRFRQRGDQTWLESNGDTIEMKDTQIQGVVLSFERRVE